MFNSTILDVIIGLVFCFASVALFVSSINEFVASMLKLRHKTLLAGIQKLLNDPEGTGLVKTLYEHALINPLALVVPSTAAVPGPEERAAAAAPAAAPPPPRTVEPRRPEWAKQIPAYIASRDFAHAMIDIIQSEPGRYASLAAAIEGEIADPQLRQTMLGVAARAQGNIEKFSNGLADWFDNAMDRLSGSYKRRAQAMTFAIGFATALVLNIDAFYVLGQLWERPALAAAISSPGGEQLVAALVAAQQSGAAEAVSGAAIAASGGAAPSSAAADASADTKKPGPKDLLDRLNALPVGWGVRDFPAWGGVAPLKFLGFYASFLAGLIVTASSAVFGAPFWFDLLQRLIQIRGTGARPQLNRDRETAETATAAPAAAAAPRQPG